MSASVLYCGAHRAQQRDGRELAALVDPHAERVFLGDVDFDPAAPFGDNAAAGQLAVAGPVLLEHEVDAGTAMQLADHDAFGTVDDELAATEHDGEVAQVDLFLVRFFLVQAQHHAEGASVGQAQLTAFVGRVAGFAQLVPVVLERNLLVVAFDREDLAQHALQALVLPLLGRHVILQEGGIADSLDLREIGSQKRLATAAKTTDFLGFKSSFLGGSHVQQSSMQSESRNGQQLAQSGDDRRTAHRGAEELRHGWGGSARTFSPGQHKHKRTLALKDIENQACSTCIPPGDHGRAGRFLRNRWIT